MNVINLKVVDCTHYSAEIEFDFDPVCSKSIRPVKKDKGRFQKLNGGGGDTPPFR